MLKMNGFKEYWGKENSIKKKTAKEKKLKF